MALHAGRVLIYGGRGALGSQCVSIFKSNNYWVGSIDFKENPEADLNISINTDHDVDQQENYILDKLNETLQDGKFDTIICVAGGWAGGNASNNLIKNSSLMFKQSVWSSLISASIASQRLNPGGLLVLTGAQAALKGTPGMIGYGMAKASVHHLVKSLAQEGSGIPEGVTTAAILPITLDTPSNRKWMPNADHSTWTPLEYISELFLKWTRKEDLPKNGTLCQLITKNSITEITPA